MRVHAITLGCQMSAADGSDTVAALTRIGWQRADTPEQADALILTTCSVRKHAEHRAISLIGRLRVWKAAAPGRVLVVAGCVAERLGPELTRRFPHVDMVVGARQAGRYPELIAAELDRRFGGSRAEPAAAPSGPTATVTIMRGCDCACAYCIVPAVRGPEACRTPEDILAEVRAKTAAGAREITLLGQRVNAYRCERGAERTDFSALLRAIDRTPGLARLRFMSPHPGCMDDELIAAVRECPSVCEWLHLPAQSGCDRLLRAMRRDYTRARFLDTAERLRRARPGVVLSTDIIVGFPSETETDFAQSLTLLEELRPATAFCFKYSAREGTPAADMPDDVPPRVKEERLAAANELVDALTREALQAQVGGVAEVLAETPDFGRTRTGFKARWDRPVEPGSMIRIRIVAATRRTLLGEFHDSSQER